MIAISNVAAHAPGPFRAPTASFLAISRSPADRRPDHAAYIGHPGDPGDDCQRDHRARYQWLSAGGNAGGDVLAQLAVRPGLSLCSSVVVLDGLPLQAPY